MSIIVRIRYNHNTITFSLSNYKGLLAMTRFIVHKIKLLYPLKASAVFTIDIVEYHYFLVLHCHPEIANLLVSDAAFKCIRENNGAIV